MHAGNSTESDTPPLKRQKMEDSAQSTTTTTAQEPADSDTTKDLLSEIQAVLSDIELRGLEFEEVYVTNITDPKQASKIIAEVNSVLPLSHLTHLKRIKRGSQDKKDPQLSILLNSKAAWEATMEELTIAEATTTTTTTTAETAVSSETKVVITTIVASTKTPTSSANLLHMRNHMSLAVAEAQKAKALGQRPIGVVIVDPRTQQVVAASHDRTRETSNPQNKAPLLAHACMNCIGVLAKEHMRTQTTEQYLATGYHVYTTYEPCPMCAMALVHSRVSRVIYGTASPTGALGSKYKLHTVPSLNHHYQVYKGVLRKECSSLWE